MGTASITGGLTWLKYITTVVVHSYTQHMGHAVFVISQQELVGFPPRKPKLQGSTGHSISLELDVERVMQALVSVLLVYCTVVCASQEDDQLVTASVFRRELNRAKDAMVTTMFKIFYPGHTPSHPAASCKEILQLAPQSPSGLYWLRGTDNRPRHMYCDMERSCKGVAGGWMRVASIDMNDTSSTCPSGLKTLTSPQRVCANNTASGCSSTVFSVQGVEYSQVCGKIIGYQFGSTDGFYRFTLSQVLNDIEREYVDGVSVTHGTNPRKHIWTSVAALHEDLQSVPHYKYTCPCTLSNRIPPANPQPQVPTFMAMTTFVIPAVSNISRKFSMEMILSGMVLDVVHSVPAVTGTLHHGSGKRSLLLLVMTLR